jgi:hypothetical protein
LYQFLGVIVVAIAQHQAVAVGERHIFAAAHNTGKEGVGNIRDASSRVSVACNPAFQVLANIPHFQANAVADLDQLTDRLARPQGVVHFQLVWGVMDNLSANKVSGISELI